MPSTCSRRTLLAGAALALCALSGCAVQRAERAQRGPSFLLKGAMAMKRPGKPVLRAQFAWSRGRGYRGWEEKITFHDRTGRRLAKIVDDGSAVTVQSGGKSSTADSVTRLLTHYTGIDVPVAALAGWFEGLHDGKTMPDTLEWRGISVQVVSRAGPVGKPSELLLAHRETRLLVDIERTPGS